MKNYVFFFEDRKLSVEHTVFITLDNILFGPEKSEILKIKIPDVNASDHVRERDIALNLIEEFQTSEVPEYARALHKHKINEISIAEFTTIVKALCDGSQKILQVFAKGYKKLQLTAEESGNPVIVSVRKFFDDELNRRKSSKLRMTFEKGRVEITLINKAIYDVERVGPRASPESYARIISGAQTLEANFRTSFTDLSKISKELVAKGHEIPPTSAAGASSAAGVGHDSSSSPKPAA